jgi:hypothetical protein
MIRTKTALILAAILLGLFGLWYFARKEKRTRTNTE